MSSFVNLRFIPAAAAAGIAFCMIPDPAAARPAGTTAQIEAVTVDGGRAGVRTPLAEPTSEEAFAAATVTHARNQKRLQAQSTAAKGTSAQSVDVDVDGDGLNDIAVLVDNGRIILPARPTNPLDLESGMRFDYAPAGADAFSVTFATGQTLDTGLGPDLFLGDDDFAEVALAAPFPFLGQSYDSVFVGSDGHITLGAGDNSSSNRNAARHIGGPPRLSALLTDLDPTCRGSVHADVRADRVVITWNDVVHFERGSDSGCGPDVPGNTIQAVLASDGSIAFTFGALDTGLIASGVGNDEAVTGIAEGNAEGPLNEIDMTADLPATLQAGAIFEEFTIGSPETFDIFQMGQEFYRTHDDKYDFLVMFTDFEIFGGGTAFHLGVQNQTFGLRRAVFDASSLAGSAGELESLLWMNNINLWAGNSIEQYTNPPVHRFAVTTSPRLTSFLGGNVTPTTAPYEQVGVLDITGDGFSNGYSHHGRALIHENPNTEARARQGALRYDLNSAISIMFQEADHRWAAFPVFLHPDRGISIPDSFDLLGRALAHWSTFFNTRVVDSPFAAADGRPRFSGMEGNAIIELALGGGGSVVDRNDPDRVIADPDGSLGAAIASCDVQGKSLFLTEPEELIDGATELDQYLMGVRLAGDVGPFWYVDEPSSPFDGSSLDEPFPTDFIRGSTFNVDDIAFCGTRVDLTVTNITEVGRILNAPTLGPRIPAIGDENDVGPVEACLAENIGGAFGPCVDVKTMAWILVVRQGAPKSLAHQPAIKRLNEFRLAWQAYADGPGLGGRNADGVERAPGDPDFVSKFDTSLEPAIH